MEQQAAGHQGQQQPPVPNIESPDGLLQATPQGATAAEPAAAAAGAAVQPAGSTAPGAQLGQQAFELLEKFLGKQQDLQAELLPTLTNVSTVHLQCDDVLNFIAVQKWVEAHLGMRLQLLAGTIATVNSADLTAAAQRQLLEGNDTCQLQLQQPQQQHPCEVAVAAAVPLRLRQVARVVIPVDAASAGDALLELVGGGVVLAKSLSQVPLQSTLGCEELCCELAELQQAGVAPVLRLHDLAHTIWRLRLCAALEDDISHCNQEQAELANQGYDAEMLEAARLTTFSMMRDRMRMLPKTSYTAEIMSYVQLSTGDAAGREQQLADAAARWHQYVQRQLVASKQPPAPQLQQSQQAAAAAVAGGGMPLPPGLSPDTPRPVYNSWNTAVPPGLDMSLEQQVAVSVQPMGSRERPTSALPGLMAADADEHGFFEDPFAAAGPDLSPLKLSKASLDPQMKAPQGTLGFGMASWGGVTTGGFAARQQRAAGAGGAAGGAAGARGYLAGPFHQQLQLQQQQQQQQHEGEPAPVLQALMSKYSTESGGPVKQGSCGSEVAAAVERGGADGGGSGGGSDYLFWVKQGDITAAQNDPRTRRAQALMQSRSGSFASAVDAVTARGSGDWTGRLSQQQQQATEDVRGLPAAGRDSRGVPLYHQHSSDRDNHGGGFPSSRPPHHHISNSSRYDGNDRGAAAVAAGGGGISHRHSSDAADKGGHRGLGRPATAPAAAAASSEHHHHRLPGSMTNSQSHHKPPYDRERGSPLVSPTHRRSENQHRGARSRSRSRSWSRDKARRGLDREPQGKQSSNNRDAARDKERADYRRQQDAGRDGDRSRDKDRCRKRSRSRSRSLPGRDRSRSPTGPSASHRQRPAPLQLSNHHRAAVSASPHSQLDIAGNAGRVRSLSSPGPVSLDTARRRFAGRLEGADSIFGHLSAESAVKDWLRKVVELQHRKAGTLDCHNGWFGLGYLRQELPIPREVVNVYGGVFAFLISCPAVSFNRSKKLVRVNGEVDIESMMLPAVGAAASTEDKHARHRDRGRDRDTDEGCYPDRGRPSSHDHHHHHHHHHHRHHHPSRSRSRSRSRDRHAAANGRAADWQEKGCDRQQQLPGSRPAGRGGGVDEGGRLQHHAGAADGAAAAGSGGRSAVPRLRDSEVGQLLRSYTDELLRALSVSPRGELEVARAAALLPAPLQSCVRANGPIDLPKLLEDHVPCVEVVPRDGREVVRELLPASKQRKPHQVTRCNFWQPQSWSGCMKGATCRFKHYLAPRMTW